jgi:hypothetical protein
MKQLVTVFRAEGAQATRVAELCEATPVDELFSLRDFFRKRAFAASQFSAYMEFIDSWSMWDSFADVAGENHRLYESRWGEVYVTEITPRLTSSLRKMAKKKRQPIEDARLARVFADLATTCYLPDGPALLILFREILDGTTTDEEIAEGSNQLLNPTQ